MPTPAQDKWDRTRQEFWNGLPTHLDHKKRQKEAIRLTVKSRGRRPKGPPVHIRVGLWVAKRKVASLMGKKSGIPKILLAGVFGLLASYSVVDMALAEPPITGQEWLAIANAALVAALAKFSNPEKMISHKPSVD